MPDQPRVYVGDLPDAARTVEPGDELLVTNGSAAENANIAAAAEGTAGLVELAAADDTTSDDKAATPANTAAQIAANPGPQGPRGDSDIRVFRVVPHTAGSAHASTRPAKPARLTYAQAAANTAPTDWDLAENIPNYDPDTHDLWEVFASVNHAARTVSDWSVPVEAGAEGRPGAAGDPGDNGWSPVLATESDGQRRVQRVIDYVGGQGAKPVIDVPNSYLTAMGLGTKANAVDVRGAAGSASANVPSATTTEEGTVELATGAEAIAGRDTSRVLTPDALRLVFASSSVLSGSAPRALRDRVLNIIGGLSASETAAGPVEFASLAEVGAATLGNRAVSPLRLRGALIDSDTTLRRALVSYLAGLINSGSTGLQAAVDARAGSGGGTVGNASETARGIIELATAAEARAGQDGLRAVTPAGLLAAVDGDGTVLRTLSNRFRGLFSAINVTGSQAAVIPANPRGNPLAIGNNAFAAGIGHEIAIGNNALADEEFAIRIGASAFRESRWAAIEPALSNGRRTGFSSISIGDVCAAQGRQSVVLGDASRATNDQSISIGTLVNARHILTSFGQNAFGVHFTPETIADADFGASGRFRPAYYDNGTIIADATKIRQLVGGVWVTVGGSGSQPQTGEQIVALLEALGANAKLDYAAGLRNQPTIPSVAGLQTEAQVRAIVQSDSLTRVESTAAALGALAVGTAFLTTSDGSASVPTGQAIALSSIIKSPSAPGSISDYVNALTANSSFANFKQGVIGVRATPTIYAIVGSVTGYGISGGGGGTIATLASIADVTAPTANNQILIWNSSTNRWEPGALPTGGTVATLSDIGDVGANIATAANDGEPLIWDNLNGRWLTTKLPGSLEAAKPSSYGSRTIHQSWIPAGNGGADDPNLHFAWTQGEASGTTWADVFGLPYSYPAIPSFISNNGSANLAMTATLPSGYTLGADGKLTIQSDLPLWAEFAESGIDYTAVKATFNVNRSGQHQDVAFWFGADGRVQDWSRWATANTTKGLAVASSLSSGRVLVFRADDNRYLGADGGWRASPGGGGDFGSFTPAEGDNAFEIVYLNGRLIVRHNGAEVNSVNLAVASQPDISGGNHGVYLARVSGAGGSTAATLRLDAMAIEDPDLEDILGEEMNGGGLDEAAVDARIHSDDNLAVPGSDTPGVVQVASVGDARARQPHDRGVVNVEGMDAALGGIPTGTQLSAAAADFHRKLGVEHTAGEIEYHGGFTKAWELTITDRPNRTGTFAGDTDGLTISGGNISGETAKQYGIWGFRAAGALVTPSATLVQWTDTDSAGSNVGRIWISTNSAGRLLIHNPSDPTQSTLVASADRTSGFRFSTQNSAGFASQIAVEVLKLNPNDPTDDGIEFLPTVILPDGSVTQCNNIAFTSGWARFNTRAVHLFETAGTIPIDRVKFALHAGYESHAAFAAQLAGNADTAVAWGIRTAGAGRNTPDYTGDFDFKGTLKAHNDKGELQAVVLNDDARLGSDGGGGGGGTPRSWVNQNVPASPTTNVLTLTVNDDTDVSIGVRFRNGNAGGPPNPTNANNSWGVTIPIAMIDATRTYWGGVGRGASNFAIDATRSGNTVTLRGVDLNNNNTPPIRIDRLFIYRS